MSIFDIFRSFFAIAVFTLVIEIKHSMERRLAWLLSGMARVRLRALFKG